VVNFNASQSKATPGRSITSYRWDFGDGSFGEGMIQTHRYETVGTYKVLLTVTDGSGKQATFVGDVKVAVPEIPK
jgi:PKD repeat protein